MVRSLLSMPRLFITISALAAGAIAAMGCTSQVSSGGDGGGGAGGEENGTGGGAPATCTTLGATQACALGNDTTGQPTGQQQCLNDADGDLRWTACTAASASSTPLVLSFDDAPVAFQAGLRAFDLTGTMSVATDWPTARTPWLALDRNGNGAVDDGAELFGSATVLTSGERAENGFLALRELDTDHDGQITSADAGWSELRLWADGNADRVSSAGELIGLGARRLVSIDLAYGSERRCDDRGNCEVERAAFRYLDEAGVTRTGTIIDVHLRHR